MKIFAAICTAVLLCAASFGLLVAADEATDASAIAGGTGIVIAGAFLGLTILASRWRAGTRAYTTSSVESDAFYDDLAATFDADGQPMAFDDAAAI